MSRHGFICDVSVAAMQCLNIVPVSELDENVFLATLCNYRMLSTAYQQM
jgi:hypothetical protein